MDGASKVRLYWCASMCDLDHVFVYVRSTVKPYITTVGLFVLCMRCFEVERYVERLQRFTGFKHAPRSFIFLTYFNPSISAWHLAPF